ncbi:MAG: hypothetical protein BWY78_01107 [Alphaproteobacteria bacterium ADurb.Bin438]|nr:MAG: hypothetical protein BWY78_01107 [Alphaproteobacteria bacterium ADurb.Bin438]
MIKKIVFWLLFLCLVCFLMDFSLFLREMNKDNKNFDEKFDAIIVLTGGIGRIEKAIELMTSTNSDVLFISGVNENVSLSLLKDANNIKDEINEKIKIGYFAKNTYQNASEISSFALKNNLKNIMVVTSYYHMPRSLVELSFLNSEIKITPYKVFNEDTNNYWWEDFYSSKLIITEYLKYIVARIRKKLT